MQYNWEVRWKDYYKVLQVHPTASQEVIKAAYDRLARKYHPDANPNVSSHSIMILLNEAYEVLGNLSLRRQYHPIWLQKRRESKRAQYPSNTMNNESWQPPQQSTQYRRGSNKAKEREKQSFPVWLTWTIIIAIVFLLVAISTAINECS